MADVTPDREKLRQLAERAGAHQSDSGWFVDGSTNEGLSEIRDGLQDGMFPVVCEKPQADFIVAAQPAAVLSLLDEIEQLEADNKANICNRPDARWVRIQRLDEAHEEITGLRADLAEARGALAPFALEIKAHVPGEQLMTAFAWSADELRRAASVHSRLSGEGE